VTAAVALGEPRWIALPGGTLAYTLRRSRRARRLRVTIDPARGVLVTLPVRGSIRAAEGFLREREAWLRRHLRTQEQRWERAAASGAFGPAGCILFQGELHRVRAELAEPGVRRSRVLRVGGERHDELVVVLAPADRRGAAQLLEAWFRVRARAAIEAAIAVHTPALGVAPAAVTLRDPRTRWGSASRSRRLSFSWRLILAPPEALETVVVHELAHLRVFGHGAAFWDLVAARLPEHRRWRRWLHDHALELHHALDEPDPAADEAGLAARLAI
jgi:predicted metal-dependent hydrolase